MSSSLEKIMYKESKRRETTNPMRSAGGFRVIPRERELPRPKRKTAEEMPKPEITEPRTTSEIKEELDEIRKELSEIRTEQAQLSRVLVNLTNNKCMGSYALSAVERILHRREMGAARDRRYQERLRRRKRQVKKR